ncbi:MAG: glycosyltransferase family 4 protein [Clostridiaceae bacterium]
MIKALQVISGNDYGGGGVHVLNTIKSSKGVFNNNLLLVGQGPLVEKCKKENIPFQLVENKSKNPELINYINENGFDIINFHGARSVLIHLRNKKSIKPATIVTVHSDFNRDFTGSGVKKIISTWLLKKSLKSFENYIGVSDFIKNLLIESKVAKEVNVIPNAVDLEKLKVNIKSDEIKKVLNFKNDYIFSIVARLHPIKNHRNLILAFKKLVEIYDNTKLLIIGDGILEEELKKLVKDNNLSNYIKFLGFIDNPVDYVNASDVSMITSFNEGGIPPLSILESLAIGIPCISSDFQGLKAIFNDELLYIDPNSIESIYSSMKYSYENREEMKTKVKKAQEITTKEYSLENFANNYFEIYKKVLNR